MVRIDLTGPNAPHMEFEALEFRDLITASSVPAPSSYRHELHWAGEFKGTIKTYATFSQRRIHATSLGQLNTMAGRRRSNHSTGSDWTGSDCTGSDSDSDHDPAPPALISARRGSSSGESTSSCESESADTTTTKAV
mmetsp:Transcript_17071/g.33551  ORF Transcript_17071/g.33551 Transcript_17071/m.33551 type:complete len:137 (+) Transcript_17071:163-573(+)|eukprot:CAMPEP_0173385048 /NCGR_PEP_ID=MMETSP1356-20130122/7641_1 /TAXON_ID=77927 ORGANISM="Hemiselmis virescens, Strain PCC157" /NCGR_SAMPLE_ID=MMETSP1356 /ASSEMBLY_ACC=CAM_ASM_000847 /LENGTH=136 /DNA_ID=CAMNT_0014340689 /DNA_START=143 /DNA_END=553 /DNA_ORIENTATION=+